MCEYCDLVSGDERDFEYGKNVNMHIERHCNTYTLVASNAYEYIEKEINYCPMCGRKLKEEKQ